MTPGQAHNVIISLQFKDPMSSQEAATLVGKIQEMLLSDADFWRQYPSAITTEFYHEPSKEISAKAQLVTWLKGRETDIALGIEDFGALQEVFKALFKRLAKETTQQGD